jgi:hypothetical protein
VDIVFQDLEPVADVVVVVAAVFGGDTKVGRLFRPASHSLAGKFLLKIRRFASRAGIRRR